MGSTLAWRHGRSDPQKLSSGAVSAPAWSLAAARGIPMRKVLRQRGGSRSTFYRRAEVRFAGSGRTERKTHLIWINRRRSHPHTNIGRSRASQSPLDACG